MVGREAVVGRGAVVGRDAVVGPGAPVRRPPASPCAGWHDPPVRR
ncbi:hypothetical protein KCV87_11390 [Actinosynnema pretiosum subsp. pretiosum]|uniref:Uncharacterized protein n=1 Tax=Actinosynnema pretiosum subsp. pretiosum TaxID=103721 RepID=A0AA45LB91_9PSEU|nr:hypothetical protein KCV87_11390 [Actinosynnema pretiosum subsp. pretiosum]